jgi:hypothetical protein
MCVHIGFWRVQFWVNSTSVSCIYLLIHPFNTYLSHVMIRKKKKIGDEPYDFYVTKFRSWLSLALALSEHFR